MRRLRTQRRMDDEPGAPPPRPLVEQRRNRLGVDFNQLVVVATTLALIIFTLWTLFPTSEQLYGGSPSTATHVSETWAMDPLAWTSDMEAEKQRMVGTGLPEPLAHAAVETNARSSHNITIFLTGSRSAFQSNFTQQSLWNKVEYAHFRRYRVRIEHLQCQVLQAQANKNKTATQLQGQDSSAAKAQASEGNLRGHNGGQDQPNVGNAGVASIQADLVQAAGGAMNSKQLAQAHKFKALADCMWERFELIRSALRTEPDGTWLWVLDLDTIIMDPHVKLEDIVTAAQTGQPFIEQGLHAAARQSDFQATKEFIIAARCNVTNVGSFLLRVGDWGRTFMDDVIKVQQQPELLPRYCLTCPQHPEQDAVNYTMRQPAYEQRVAVVPAHWLNSLPGEREGNKCLDHLNSYKRGHLLVHFAGSRAKWLFRKYWRRRDHVFVSNLTVGNVSLAIEAPSPPPLPPKLATPTRPPAHAARRLITAEAGRQ